MFLACLILVLHEMDFFTMMVFLLLFPKMRLSSTGAPHPSALGGDWFPLYLMAWSSVGNQDEQI